MTERRISRRVQLALWLGAVIVFAAAFLLLRPTPDPRSDADYVAIAKTAPQGREYFSVYPAECQVTRVWTVQVSCDYRPAGEQIRHFRAYIDPRSGAIIEIQVGSAGGL